MKVWVKVAGDVLGTLGFIGEMQVFVEATDLQGYVDQKYTANGYKARLLEWKNDHKPCREVSVMGQLEEVFILCEVEEDATTAATAVPEAAEAGAGPTVSDLGPIG